MKAERLLIYKVLRATPFVFKIVSAAALPPENVPWGTKRNTPEYLPSREETKVLFTRNYGNRKALQ